MNKFLVSVLVAFIVFTGCKNDTTNTSSPAIVLSVEEANVLHNSEGWVEEEIQRTRLQASDILGHRIKESDRSRAHVLLNSIWHVNAVLRGSQVTFGEDVKGGWFKFDDKNSYQVGSYDQVIGGGRYHYDTEKSIVLLLNNDPRMKPQEFNVLTNNNAVVFVGEATYRDNNMQCKLNREEKFPVKEGNTVQ